MLQASLAQLPSVVHQRRSGSDSDTDSDDEEMHVIPLDDIAEHDASHRPHGHTDLAAEVIPNKMAVMELKDNCHDWCSAVTCM